MADERDDDERAAARALYGPIRLDIGARLGVRYERREAGVADRGRQATSWWRRRPPEFFVTSAEAVWDGREWRADGAEPVAQYAAMAVAMARWASVHLPTIQRRPDGGVRLSSAGEGEGLNDFDPHLGVVERFWGRDDRAEEEALVSVVSGIAQGPAWDEDRTALITSVLITEHARLHGADRVRAVAEQVVEGDLRDVLARLVADPREHEAVVPAHRRWSLDADELGDRITWTTECRDGRLGLVFGDFGSAAYLGDAYPAVVVDAGSRSVTHVLQTAGPRAWSVTRME